MADSGLRARVKRLLGDDFRIDDLATLFLYARDHCDGRETIKEIGDFIAHHTERDKGLVVRTARDFAVIIKYFFQQAGRDINPRQIPPDFGEFLKAKFRRFDHASIKSSTGLTKKAAGRLLPQITSKFIQNSDGTLSISPHHTEKEIAVMKGLCHHMVVVPAFRADRLFGDLVGVLKSQGLLHKAETEQFRSLMPAISLFAVSKMHNCEISLTGGGRAQLKVQANKGGSIAVRISVPTVLDDEGGLGQVASDMFDTELLTETYCEPSLLQRPLPWECDLELTPNQLLGALD